MEILQHKGTYLIITFKVTITLFGAIILGIGLHSHYQSSWLSYHASTEKINVTEQNAKYYLENPSQVKTAHVCEVHNFLIHWGWAPEGMQKCPDILMERFFVGVIIAAFIISFVGMMLLSSRVVNMDMQCWQIMEVLYHGLFSVLLFGAGVVYIHSANKIVAFTKPDKDDIREIMSKLMTQEKIAAGSFTIMQAVLYGLVAAIIGSRIRK